MTGALITSEVDFYAEGTQAGYPRLPHSVHRDKGQIAVAALARQMKAENISGRLGGGASATDDPVRTAMRFACPPFKFVTEPVVGFAALMEDSE